MNSKTLVCIIGGGQSGIAAAYHLKKCNIPYTVIDQNQYVGQTWAERYDSLTLDSLRKYSHLFRAYPFPGEPNGQPTKDEVVSYLQHIVASEQLNIHLDEQVLSVTPQDDRYSVHTTKNEYNCSHIIVATGAFYSPYIPLTIPSRVPHIHSKEYKNVGQIPGKSVLILGGGNSGCEIARELLEHNKKVTISHTKSRLPYVKNSALSQWIAYVLGVAHVPFWHPIGTLALWYTKGKSIGDDAAFVAQHSHCTLIEKVSEISDTIQTVDGNTHPLPDYIIAATGFRPQYPWIDIPKIKFSSTGEIKHLHGKTHAKNVFVLGQRWQYSKSSSHITGVNRDAFVIAHYIRGTTWITNALSKQKHL